MKNKIILDGTVCQCGEPSDVEYGHWEFNLRHEDPTYANKNLCITVCISGRGRAEKLSKKILPDMNLRVEGELRAECFECDFFIEAERIWRIGGDRD